MYHIHNFYTIIPVCKKPKAENAISAFDFILYKFPTLHNPLPMQ